MELSDAIATTVEVEGLELHALTIGDLARLERVIRESIIGDAIAAISVNGLGTGDKKIVMSEAFLSRKQFTLMNTEGEMQGMQTFENMCRMIWLSARHKDPALKYDDLLVKIGDVAKASKMLTAVMELSGWKEGEDEAEGETAETTGD